MFVLNCRKLNLWEKNTIKNLAPCRCHICRCQPTILTALQQGIRGRNSRNFSLWQNRDRKWFLVTITVTFLRTKSSTAVNSRHCHRIHRSVGRDMKRETFKRYHYQFSMEFRGSPMSNRIRYLMKMRTIVVEPNLYVARLELQSLNENFNFNERSIYMWCLINED